MIDSNFYIYMIEFEIVSKLYFLLAHQSIIVSTSQAFFRQCDHTKLQATILAHQIMNSLPVICIIRQHYEIRTCWVFVDVIGVLLCVRFVHACEKIQETNLKLKFTLHAFVFSLK